VLRPELFLDAAVYYPAVNGTLPSRKQYRSAACALPFSNCFRWTYRMRQPYWTEDAPILWFGALYSRSLSATYSAMHRLQGLPAPENMAEWWGNCRAFLSQ